MIRAAARGWRAYVQPYGGDQQLMVALRTKPGEAWGLLALYREGGQREFGLAPLLMAAYGLTDREKDVTHLVLQGETTTGIAGRLFISPQTVQQHLKAIFDKTGVRSRRELTGQVFFAHYEPRVRDNERRAQAERPFRGGPTGPLRGGPV